MTRSIRTAYSFGTFALTAVLWQCGAGKAVAAATPAVAAAQVDKTLLQEMQGETSADDSSAPSKAARHAPGKTAAHAAGAYPTEPADTTAASSGSKPASPAQPAGMADDETYLRRATMDLIGRPPTPKEITEFALDPSADKRARVVERLLQRPEFGENWGRYWRDVIDFRRADDRALLGAQAIESYLTEQFNKNTPWDQTARSFITATGDVRENGATGIIFAQNGETADITSEVARIFMGIQIQCAQCHDHPTDRWKRNQFHELAAFFTRVGLQPSKIATPQRTFIVFGSDRQRVFKNNNQPHPEAEHYMPDLKNPTSKGTKMLPVFFLTGQKLPEGTPDEQRRSTIAKWITGPQDPWFAKAFVNRVWAELVGEGFYEPVDDIGPDRECNAPETLDYLAKQFADHNYDVKWVFRAITATAAYQRDSRSRHLPGQTPYLANCPQRLRADELFDALTSALGVDGQQGLGRVAMADAPKKAGPYARTPRTQFDFVFGYDPSIRRDEVVGSIPQALVLMNSPQLARGITGTGGTGLAKLLDSTKDDNAVVEELYLRALAREPKPDEVKTCLAHVKKTGNRSEAFEDVLWALINSTEFMHRK